MDIITSIIFGLAGACLAWLGYKVSKKALVVSTKQAKWDGAMGGKWLDLKLYNQDTTAYTFTAPLEPKRILNLPLKFTLENIGNRTVEDVELSIRIPKVLCFGEILSLHEENQSLKKLQCKSINETEYIARTMLGVDSLHPGQVFGVSVDLSLIENLTSWQPIKVPAITADNVSVVFHCLLRTNWLITFNVSAKDKEVFNKSFKLGLYNSNNKKTLFEILGQENDRIVRSAKKSKDKLHKFLYDFVYGKWEPYAIVNISKQNISKDKDKKTPIDKVENIKIINGLINPKNAYIQADGVKQAVLPGEKGATLKLNIDD